MDFNAISDAMQSGTSESVKLWMNWMALAFIASLIFVKSYKTARWAFAAIIATVICAGFIWVFSQNIELFGIAHLLFWSPLAVYLWTSALSPSARKTAPAQSSFAKAHLVWAALLFITILISLVFDLRDIYLVTQGVK